MASLERELARQRRARLQVEREQAREITRTYRMIYRRMKAKLKELSDLIEAERKAGRTPKTSWLVQQWQYQDLLREVEAQVWAWSRQHTETIAEGQRRVLSTLNQDQRRLIQLSLFPAPTEVVATVTARFIGLNPLAIESFIGIAGDGKPLGNLLAEIAPKTVQKVKDQLAFDLAAGSGPRKMAQNFRKVASLPLDRALTISRTETLRAYRDAASQTFQQNADILQGWLWHAELDDRTCPACAAMNGTILPTETGPGMHVNCRCSMEPVTKTWKDLGFDGMEQYDRTFQTPDQMFDALDPATQRSILGPGRYDLYQSGQISTKDFVRVKSSPEWGRSHVTKPLKDLAV